MMAQGIPTPLEMAQALRTHFGFREFRPGQEAAIRSAMSGHDTLVLMPTGSGKSLCYQLPGLSLRGTTVVVSPLIALMKDQVDGLRERGHPVVAINSTLSVDERRVADWAVATGEKDFVFTTPEQLASADFRSMLRRHPIDLFVVDEAHCLSQWGHDFRPEYLNLGRYLDDLGRPPVLAMTATATPDVIRDILGQLGIPDAEIVHTGFDRPNLSLEVYRVFDEADRRAHLIALLDSEPGPTIVYVPTVKCVDELTALLREIGIEAEGYHGRLGPAARHEAQERFMGGGARVMVATNAFGMGIDKADIRRVVHHGLPPTIEAYYQEVGRAGRDGLPAVGTLLYHRDDPKLQRFFQGARYPDAEDLVNVHHALKRLATGAEAPTLDELQAISPVPKTRLKVVLALFERKGIARQVEGGHLLLIQPDLTADELERVGRSYQEIDANDRRKHQQIVDYAESRSCRWASILDYFESGAQAPQDGCGRCDRCAPPLPLGEVA